MSQPNPNPNPEGDGAYGWGPTQPGYGYPNPAPAPGYGYPGAGGPGYDPTQAGQLVPVGGGAPLVSIGDITVMNHGIVTPAGTLPLRGAVWNATDMSRTEEKIPAHAIVLAVVFFLFCLLGLLFLLMKERKTTGFIQVMVTSGGKHHSTMVPATGPDSFQIIMGQVGYARSLSSM
ncbi:hypothetical protein OG292_13660 [Streptomyces sp. NBC_01511]|uniref:hypothetical protein n=1 Tax=unclassified Streptomyces TaxID=2593676 RepID=UPI0038705A32